MSCPVYKLEVLPGKEIDLGAMTGVTHWSVTGEQSYFVCSFPFYYRLYLLLLLFYSVFNYQTLLIPAHKFYF